MWRFDQNSCCFLGRDNLGLKLWHRSVKYCKIKYWYLFINQNVNDCFLFCLDHWAAVLVLIASFYLFIFSPQRLLTETSQLDNDPRLESATSRSTTRSSSWSTATPARSSDRRERLTAASVTTVSVQNLLLSRQLGSSLYSFLFYNRIQLVCKENTSALIVSLHSFVTVINIRGLKNLQAN